MTEAPTAVTRTDGRAAPAPGLCGKAVPQVEIRVLDEKDQPVATGEIGEICVAPRASGPWAGVYTPMLGYWNKPDETAQALRNGVYHSGDLGFLDASGDLYIRGRRNELILRGGANVYPAEVERVLAAHPAVAASAVLGRPDPRLGQRVVAAVQLRAGAQASADELTAFARERVARYKLPEQIAFVSELPRNAMGKVVKRELEGLFP
jgi:acyl-CoA synthetase (AMP-forming)/AMP-acid ligase II